MKIVKRFFVFIFHPAYLRNVENFSFFPVFRRCWFSRAAGTRRLLKKIPDAVNLKESITSTTRTEESKKRTKTRRKHFFVSLDDSSSHFYTRRHHHHRIQPGGLSQMILFGLVQIVFPFCLYVQPGVSLSLFIPPPLSFPSVEQWIEQIYIHQQIT